MLFLACSYSLYFTNVQSCSTGVQMSPIIAGPRLGLRLQDSGLGLESSISMSSVLSSPLSSLHSPIH